MEQGALQAALGEITATGAALVSLTPEVLCEIRTLDLAGHPFNRVFDKVALPARSFPVLMDRGNAVARQYGLVHGFPSALITLYKQFGIDLARHNGDATWTLPFPATYVIDPAARIRYADVRVDYRNRVEPATIIEALTRLHWR